MIIQSVDYYYSTDIFARAHESLRRAIGQYAARSKYIYIGLTQQKPEDRFRQHQKKWDEGHKWDRMIVIYKARSFNQMVLAEMELIEYIYERIEEGHYSCLTLNNRDSQAPKAKEEPDGYWVYMLVQYN